MHGTRWHSIALNEHLEKLLSPSAHEPLNDYNSYNWTSCWKLKTKWNWNITSTNNDHLALCRFHFGKCFRCLAGCTFALDFVEIFWAKCAEAANAAVVALASSYDICTVYVLTWMVSGYCSGVCVVHHTYQYASFHAGFLLGIIYIEHRAPAHHTAKCITLHSPNQIESFADSGMPFGIAPKNASTHLPIDTISDQFFHDMSTGE